ncbi:DNA-binding storekeeper protein-related transcriptional regulator [Arabidopsis thaliana]|uniref:DNA-binding storekeeper protein-related transcriptional regulator n=1 Tax=Arabidopsis thaliana TaxID=3702 RepID=A0A1P8AVW9_ARATH|nr:DNA-binding storekeeper protein-related transcriptional regulator [Arabidopsis thaliana]ANM60796.1 DNA-binding storekeeper protein-related transcriptional regulator [Arabidopsis thaliana]|eukprot:NP_001323056.1 DNA-binding storekeeper protein-related transcriptional regulator [Arabidopsis thaliana]
MSRRFNPLEDPPSASSSDEEGKEIARNSSSDDEDDVSSENPSPLKTTLDAVSDSESGSDEETDSDSELEKKKDQVVTNPVDVKRAKKVSGEEEKKKSGGGGEETKKTYFQRLWTEDDEIVVLQGLIDDKKDTGVSNTNKVYELVKKSISFDVSKNQLMEKLRALKKKYENNLGKAKDGVEPTFVKPHDRKAFELSKLVWGGIRMALASGMKSNEKSKKSSKFESVKHELDSSLPNSKNNCEDEVMDEGEVSFTKSSLVRSIVGLGMDELTAQQGLSKLASKDMKRFYEQWKAMQAREFEFFLQKHGFLFEVLSKISEAFGSNA